MQDSNENFELEDLLDAARQGQYIPDIPDDDDDRGDTEAALTEYIQDAEDEGDMENHPHLQRTRAMLGARQYLNWRHQQRLADIRRRQTLENQREKEERRMARNYARQQGMALSGLDQQEDQDREAELQVKRIKGKTLTPSEQRELRELQGSGVIAGMGFATYLG
jgi:hypothetical protein